MNIVASHMLNQYIYTLHTHTLCNDLVGKHWFLCVNRSATKGAQVKYGDGEIKGASAIEFDNEIGDLVQHTYTVSIYLYVTCKY